MHGHGLYANKTLFVTTGRGLDLAPGVHSWPSREVQSMEAGNGPICKECLKMWPHSPKSLAMCVCIHRNILLLPHVSTIMLHVAKQPGSLGLYN